MSSESSSVKVAVRIRPLNIDNSSHPSIECSNSFIQSNQLEKQVKVVGASSLPILSDSLFTFDHVFDESSSQTTIYNECVNDLVISTMDGFNATVLAYGQTGSGKSYTMGTLGNNESWDSMGIIPRAAEQIFATINEREANDPRVTIKISIQFLEVYGDDVRDLLDKSHSSKLVLREASNGDVLVLGAREELCTSAADVVELLVTGSRNRATAATSMNDSSSRSHGNLVYRNNIILENQSLL